MNANNTDAGPMLAPPAAPPVHPHYPFITRTLLELLAAGELPNIQSVTIEPEYGYVGRIVYQNGTIRMFRNTMLDINANGAAEIARDKGYTKFFLQQLGYAAPRGRAFLFPHYVHLIERNLSRFGFHDYTHIKKLFTYIEEEIGYPCYLKPNSGSKGHEVRKCFDQEDVQEALESYSRHGIDIVLAEETIYMPDYRVLVLRGEVIACYLRRPLTVVGDGRATMRELLLRRQAEMTAHGRSALIDVEDQRIIKKLRHTGLSLESVLPAGLPIAALDVSNLSAGGDAEDWSERIHPYWRELCVRLTSDMGLAYCGVDLACADIETPATPYTILETNAAPGIDNFAAIGECQAAKVRSIYRRIFNEELQ